MNPVYSFIISLAISLAIFMFVIITVDGLLPASLCSMYWIIVGFSAMIIKYVEQIYKSKLLVYIQNSNFPILFVTLFSGVMVFNWNIISIIFMLLALFAIWNGTDDLARSG